MMSGHKFNASLPFPCYGSVTAKERGYVDGMLPFVQLGKAIDRRFNGGIAGFLGDEFNPFEVHEDPSAAVFRVRDLSVGTDAERSRLDRRYAMLSELEAYQRAAESNPNVVKARDEFYEKAHGIITSPAAKKAFDVAAEPERVRERYGKTQLGQQCLLARRLVEAGVRFVTVNYGGWDHHAKVFESLDKKLPEFDRGLSALVEDMSIRGTFRDTLLVVMGEFGRTPKINKDAGRDHWGPAGSLLFAGAGVKPGLVLGKTDKHGAYATQRPVAPADVAYTILDSLGIDPRKHLYTPDGRPVEILDKGEAVTELFA
jgi:uncharacterized protein (DUF1501 family)